MSNQRVGKPIFKKPVDVVRWLGAVQAQDYLGSLWGIGLRTKDATERVVESAIADRSIVRTWPMRGTLHFVPAQDIRWMLKLLTPRVIARSASRYRQLELDERTFARSKDVLVRALQGGRTLTRNEMYGVLEAAHISTIGQRGIHILGHLAQNGLICFAARQAKQQTFALLEEWVPVTRTLERDEGLAELTRGYFTSRGPATLQDFVWWSGLKTTDARAGIEMVRKDLEEDVIEGQAYWFPPRAASKRQLKNGVAAHLLPAYDEYTVAYKDRSALLSPTHANESKGILSPTILMNGRVVGTWKRAFQKDTVVITPSPFARLNNTEAQALTTASNRYGKFLGASETVLYDIEIVETMKAILRRSKNTKVSR